MPTDSDNAVPELPRHAGGHWQLRLLGAMEARNGEVLVTRFVSRPTAALLARLALWPQRMHPREELIDLLWPDAALDVGRNRLRQSLAALKRVLEPPGYEGPAVLLADRHALRINPQVLSCDVTAFERCAQQGRADEARALYQGELLPGFYDEWVLQERTRLAALAERLGPAETVALAVAAPGLPAAASGRTPTPAVLSAPQPLAPAYLTRLFGREADLQQLRERVAAERLVTLSGPGGCGKTRLAAELLRQPPVPAEGAFDLLVFVPLADCGTAAQMGSQLRASLQLPPPGREHADPVVTALSGRRVLLVLDNFEQLVGEDAVLQLEHWLAQLPGLHLLLTSRRALGLPGEHEQVLAPLPWPADDDAGHRLLDNPGVALFIDRARSVRPDFQVPARQLGALGALCRELDGLPLAIEMAAARCRVFSIGEMRAALAQRFDLLTRTGPAARGRRHDSLQAAIDWSWRLLEPRQQQALAVLSVFRGGWTVADAQAVCELPDARQLLEGLVADSLVTVDIEADRSEGSAEAEDGGLRFQMLESIRAFVTERLPADRARQLRQAHRAHLLALALANQARGDGPLPEAQRLNAAEALRSAAVDGEPAFALTLALALRAHWDSVGINPELLALLDAALDQLPADAEVGAPAAVMLALLHLMAGHGAQERIRATQALERAAPDSAARALALCARVRIAFEVDRQSTGLDPMLDEAQALAQRVGAAAVEADVIGLRGMLALRHGGDPAAAERLLQQAADRHLALGRGREAWRLRYERACCMATQGRWQQGLAEAVACEKAFAAAGDRHHRLGAINLQGVLHAKRRDWAAALSAYRRCADDAWRCHNQFWLAYSLWNHGRNLARLRLPGPAARLMAFSEGHWVRHFGPLDRADRQFVRQVRGLVEHQLGPAAAAAAWREGQAMSLPQALTMALQLSEASPAEAVSG